MTNSGSRSQKACLYEIGGLVARHDFVIGDRRREDGDVRALATRRCLIHPAEFLRNILTSWPTRPPSETCSLSQFLIAGVWRSLRPQLFISTQAVRLRPLRTIKDGAFAQPSLERSWSRDEAYNGQFMRMANDEHSVTGSITVLEAMHLGLFLPAKSLAHKSS